MNILGTEKISKLMVKFAIPCVISLLVNSLYNIVDQIFIGWGVGFLGNGATNVVFPITVICLAFAMMFGDGASAYLSLKLGEKKEDEASRGVVNGLILSIGFAIFFGIAGTVFLPQLLKMFGCTDALWDYAIRYGRVIILGLPFMVIGSTLNNIIRADGNPRYAMMSMTIGAILNIVLDPIYIFVVYKNAGPVAGVEGAAIATVVSQIVTFILNIAYLKNFKSIKISKDTFRFDFSVAKKVSILGVSSFITQMSIVFVIAVENNVLGKYGALTKYGSEIPITVLGIVMKISQILNSIIIGIAVGAQPIVGFNYGAKNYDRVKETLKKVLAVSVSVSVIAFLLFQLIPDKLISVFGKGDANYIEFACMSFRIYLLLCVCNGVQIPSGIFFQAIGKSTKSAILSLSRQIVLLIPAMIILGKIFGLQGVLYSGPLADGIAFVISVSLLAYEVKHMGLEKPNSNALIDDTSTDNILKNHVVITLAREYGSGGRYVGRLIADELGIKLYDKDLIMKVAEKTGLSVEYIEENEQKRESLSDFNMGYYNGVTNSDELFIKEAEVIKELANKESCVIIGRCADFILKDRNDVIKVFAYNSMEDKISRATKFYGLDKEKAKKKLIELIN